MVEDIRFVMSHAVVAKYITHEQKEISRTWMRLLAFVQGMNPQKRETGLHIEDDNENMIFPFGLCHSIGNIHSLLVDGAFSAASSEETDEEILSGTYKNEHIDMVETGSLRHAKVGRLSRESSACSATWRSSAVPCSSKVAEIKQDTVGCLLVPPSVKWLIYECLRAIEILLEFDNTFGNRLNELFAKTTVNPGCNFSALKETLSKIRKGKYIFGRLTSSSEDHGRECSSNIDSDLGMGFEFENGKRKDNKLRMSGETESINACSSAWFNQSLMEGDAMDALHVLSSSDWPQIIYDVSSQDISVHIPLHRLLSLLLQKTLRRCFGESALTSGSSVNSLSTSCTDFFAHILRGCHPFGFSAFVMEHPLRVRVFCAEVHAGMWRKNGDAALYSCEWYRSVRWLVNHTI